MRGPRLLLHLGTAAATTAGVGVAAWAWANVEPSRSAAHRRVLPWPTDMHALAPPERAALWVKLALLVGVDGLDMDTRTMLRKLLRATQGEGRSGGSGAATPAALVAAGAHRLLLSDLLADSNVSSAAASEAHKHALDDLLTLFASCSSDRSQGHWRLLANSLTHAHWAALAEAGGDGRAARANAVQSLVFSLLAAFDPALVAASNSSSGGRLGGACTPAAATGGNSSCVPGGLALQLLDGDSNDMKGTGVVSAGLGGSTASRPVSGTAPAGGWASVDSDAGGDAQAAAAGAIAELLASSVQAQQLRGSEGAFHPLTALPVQQRPPLATAAATLSRLVPPAHATLSHLKAQAEEGAMTSGKPQHSSPALAAFLATLSSGCLLPLVDAAATRWVGAAAAAGRARAATAGAPALTPSQTAATAAATAAAEAAGEAFEEAGTAWARVAAASLLLVESGGSTSKERAVTTLGSSTSSNVDSSSNNKRVLAPSSLAGASLGLALASASMSQRRGGGSSSSSTSVQELRRTCERLATAAAQKAGAEGAAASTADALAASPLAHAAVAHALALADASGGDGDDGSKAALAELVEALVPRLCESGISATGLLCHRLALPLPAPPTPPSLPGSEGQRDPLVMAAALGAALANQQAKAAYPLLVAAALQSPVAAAACLWRGSEAGKGDDDTSAANSSVPAPGPALPLAAPSSSAPLDADEHVPIPLFESDFDLTGPSATRDPPLPQQWGASWPSFRARSAFVAAYDEAFTGRVKATTEPLPLFAAPGGATDELPLVLRKKGSEVVVEGVSYQSGSGTVGVVPRLALPSLSDLLLRWLQDSVSAPGAATTAAAPSASGAALPVRAAAALEAALFSSPPAAGGARPDPAAAKLARRWLKTALYTLHGRLLASTAPGHTEAAGGIARELRRTWREDVTALPQVRLSQLLQGLLTASAPVPSNGNPSATASGVTSHVFSRLGGLQPPAYVTRWHFGEQAEAAPGRLPPQGAPVWDPDARPAAGANVAAWFAPASLAPGAGAEPAADADTTALSMDWLATRWTTHALKALGYALAPIHPAGGAVPETHKVAAEVLLACGTVAPLAWLAGAATARATALATAPGADASTLAGLPCYLQDVAFRNSVGLARQGARVWANLCYASADAAGGGEEGTGQQQQSCWLLLESRGARTLHDLASRTWVYDALLCDLKLRCQASRALSNAAALAAACHPPALPAPPLPRYGDNLFPLLDTLIEVGGASDSSNNDDAPVVGGLDILLVHGLQGSACKTWRSDTWDPLKGVAAAEGEAAPVPLLSDVTYQYVLRNGRRMGLWPSTWLAAEVGAQAAARLRAAASETSAASSARFRVRVIAAGYDAQLWSAASAPRPHRTLAEVAGYLIPQLLAAQAGARLPAAGEAEGGTASPAPILWLTHSMGGLLAKECVLRAPGAVGSLVAGAEGEQHAAPEASAAAALLAAAASPPPSSSLPPLLPGVLAARTGGAIFYATPHLGAAVAAKAVERLEPVHNLLRRPLISSHVFRLGALEELAGLNAAFKSWVAGRSEGSAVLSPGAAGRLPPVTVLSLGEGLATSIPAALLNGPPQPEAGGRAPAAANGQAQDEPGSAAEVSVATGKLKAWGAEVAGSVAGSWRKLVPGLLPEAAVDDAATAASGQGSAAPGPQQQQQHPISVFVVPPDSANPGTGAFLLLPASNHIDISKPGGKTDPRFTHAMQAAVNTAVAWFGGAPPPPAVRA